ncbi:MAG: chemotaxis protein [Burkholderiaceae bacterium]
MAREKAKSKDPELDREAAGPDPDPAIEDSDDEGEGFESQVVRKGGDTRSLGPSDSSDSGSDVASGGVTSPDELVSDSDRAGTGERAGVDAGEIEASEIAPDRIVDADEAGLGMGLDEAEEANQPQRPKRGR